MFVWTLRDVAVVVFGLLALVCAGVMGLRQWWRELRCSHERVRETAACDAVCTACGKNLGFIGAWRARQAKG